MNKLITLPVLTSAALMGAVGFAAEPSGPVPFATATFTEVVNDVQLIPAGSTQGSKAAVKTVFNAPDLVKTGRKSRAQLTAADGTIARVGSNAVFAFDKDTRTVNLNRGSILFHSPTGKGGGAIVTNSATASVIGTTIIVTATSDGGFKMFVLEGVAKVKFPNGPLVSINPGQMTFVLPGSHVSDGGPKGGKPGPVLNFDLGAMAKDSLLIEGFGSDLPSLGKIKSEVNAQDELIVDGDLIRTGLVILGAGSADEFFLTSQDAVQAAVQAANRRADDAARLADALAGSFTYTGGSLPESFVFRTPVNIDPFGSVVGFVAGQLIINAPGLDLASLDGLPQLDVIGASTSSLDILGDLDITGLDTSRTLRLQGGAIHIADNAHVKVLFANAPTVPASVDFISFSPVAFNGVTLEAPGASLGLKSMVGDLTLNGGALISGAQLTVYSAGALNLLAGVMGDGESVSLFSVGDATLSGAKFKALSGDLDLLSSGALTLDNNAQLNGATGLTLFSGTNLSVTNAQFDSPSGDLDLSASGSVNFTGLAATAANKLDVAGSGAVAVSGGALTATTGTLTISGATLVMSTNGTLTAANGSVTLGGDTVGVSDFTINSAALTLGGRFGATATRIDLSNVTTSALSVNIAAQTLVLGGVNFANNSSVLIRTGNGTYNASVGVLAGMLNFSGVVTYNGLDILQHNLLWVPAMNIGDPSKPVHLLDLFASDFPATGTPLDFAKSSDVSFGTGAIPNGNRFIAAPTLTEADLTPPYAGTLPFITEYATRGGPVTHPATEVFGLLARNITVNGGTVDLTPFDGQLPAQASPHVDIFATGTLNWTGVFTVTGQGVNTYLEIRATDFNVTPGASFATTFATGGAASDDLAPVSFISVNPLSLDTVSIVNAPGSVNLRSLTGSVTLSSVSINAGQVGNTANTVNGGNIRVQSASDLTITGGFLKAERGLVRIEAPGTVTLSGADIRSLESRPPQTSPITQPVTVRGVTLVSIQNGTLAGYSVDIGGPAVDGAGPDLNQLDVNGTIFSANGGFGTPGIRMAAMTVNLSNVNFPNFTQVRLRSRDGILNIGSSMFGAVNFVSGIQYNGNNIMTVAGINSTVWIEQPNSVYYQGQSIVGSPIQGATGVAQSLGASVHVQKTVSPDQPGQY